MKNQTAHRLALETENRRKRAMKKLALKQQSHQPSQSETHAYRSPVKHHTPNQSVSSQSLSNSPHQSRNMTHRSYGRETRTDSYPHSGEHPFHLNQDAHKTLNSIHSSTHASHSGYKHLKTPQKVALPHALTVQELKDMTRARLASESTKCTETASYSSYDSSSVTSSLKQSRRQRVQSKEPIRRTMNDSQRSAESHSKSKVVHNRKEIGPNRSNASRFFQGFSCCSHYSVEMGDNGSVSSFVSGISESHTHVSDVSGRHRMMPTHIDLGRALSEDASDCSDYASHFAPFEATYKYSSPSGLRNLHEDRPLSADKGDLVTCFTGDHFFNPKLSGSNLNSDFASLKFIPSESPSTVHDKIMAENLRQSIGTSSTLSFSSAMSSDSHAFNRDESPANNFHSVQTDDPYIHYPMTASSRPSSGNGILPNSVAESVLGPSDLNDNLLEQFNASAKPTNLFDYDEHSSMNSNLWSSSQLNDGDVNEITSKWRDTLKLYDDLPMDSPLQNHRNLKHRTYRENDWK